MSDARQKKIIIAVGFAVGILVIVAGGYLMVISPKQTKATELQKQIDDTMARYKSSREKFDEEAPKLNDADRTKRTRELLDMEKDVQRMQREYNEDLFQRKNEERQAIAQKAFKLIEQVAEQEHLDAVLQESVWTSPRIDITDRILKLLDK